MEVGHALFGKLMPHVTEQIAIGNGGFLVKFVCGHVRDVQPHELKAIFDCRSVPVCVEIGCDGAPKPEPKENQPAPKRALAHLEKALDHSMSINGMLVTRICEVRAHIERAMSALKGVDGKGPDTKQPGPPWTADSLKLRNTADLVMDPNYRRVFPKSKLVLVMNSDDLASGVDQSAYVTVLP